MTDPASLTGTLPLPEPAASVTGPRVRIGQIVWGLIVMAIGVGALAVLGSPERRDTVLNWLLHLTPGQGWLVAVLVAGAILLLLGALALVRRLRR
ncbi:hypothetical protein [Lacisediminihabitans changchengi]|uniref:Uncharacterized protein n=1 Tax=Lacisediminihabitans changchengi TaxID=2787634 RepID=A0A934W4L1_9MICO|nr:hypothetical protein [Lacisediminihabitans changchengi]MBK4349081.1 hypothetical protein [Lacisediminihabitans changchengi]